MTLDILAIVLGLIILIFSADRFIEGAASIAKHLKVKPILIGLLVLGFGTSAPEIMVSVFAAIGGNPALALGNAIGSNIANIAMVLGITATIAAIKVHSSVIQREFPLLLAATLVAALLFFDRVLDIYDAGLLVCLLALILWWMIKVAQEENGDEFSNEVESEIPNFSQTMAWFWTLVGLVFLIASSKILVWGASNIASTLGVDDLVIGLTIVAIGTSLPELAASVLSALKKEHDMAIGNIIGSNLFNLLAVIGISGLIRPYQIPEAALVRDFYLMGFLSIFLFFIILLNRQKIGRFIGLALSLTYVVYMVVLYQQHV